MRRSSLGGGGAAEQREAFEKIKEYLVSPPVLQAPKVGNPFKMYIAPQEQVIGAVLLQEEDGKGFPVAYVSQRLLDAETQYVFMKKLCLSLYYACSKFSHYILSSSYIVACQYDVIKHMLLKLILSGRIGKWAYLVSFSSGQYCNQINFILMRREDRHACLDCKVIPGECVMPQHKLVVADFHFRVRFQWIKRVQAPRMKWWKLKEETTKMFKERVLKEGPWHEGGDANSMWMGMSTCIRKWHQKSSE
jgi:hypothetical protein